MTSMQPYKCGLHVNQRRKGSLCSNTACIGCDPYRQREQQQPHWDATTAATFVAACDVTLGTRLDLEVAADRARYEQRRYELTAAIALKYAERVSAPDLSIFAAECVQFAETILAALALTKPPAGSV